MLAVIRREGDIKQEGGAELLRKKSTPVTGKHKRERSEQPLSICGWDEHTNEMSISVRTFTFIRHTSRDNKSITVWRSVPNEELYHQFTSATTSIECGGSTFNNIDYSEKYLISPISLCFEDANPIKLAGAMQLNGNSRHHTSILSFANELPNNKQSTCPTTSTLHSATLLPLRRRTQESSLRRACDEPPRDP